jgi:hypothetical protein
MAVASVNSGAKASECAKSERLGVNRNARLSGFDRWGNQATARVLVFEKVGCRCRFAGPARALRPRLVASDSGAPALSSLVYGPEEWAQPGCAEARLTPRRGGESWVKQWSSRWFYGAACCVSLA